MTDWIVHKSKVCVAFDKSGAVLAVFNDHRVADATGELVPTEPPTQEGEYGRVPVDKTALPDADPSEMMVDNPDNPTEVIVQ